MRDELLDYYRRELQYLKRLGGEYAERYPGEAGRLGLDADGSSADPHVERLLQGVAFLNASIHRRIDDDYPRFTQAVLNALFPSLLQPVPAVTTVELVPDPQMPLPAAGLPVARKTPIFSRFSSEGTLHPCEFRTCFDLKLYPIRLSNVKWMRARNTRAAADFPAAASVLSFTLEAASDAGLNLPEMDVLRVHVNGERTWIGALYQLLVTRVEAVILRDPEGTVDPVLLAPETIRPAGFEPEEALSFEDVGTFNEHRLLQEYFAFREKFHYFDFVGLGNVLSQFPSTSVAVEIVIARFEPEDWHATLEFAVSDATLRLNCSPAVNLFDRTQGVRVDRRKTEYLLNPGWSPRTAIVSVNRVVLNQWRTGISRNVDELYSACPDGQPKGEQSWYITREPDAEGGFDVFIGLNEATASEQSEGDTLSAVCTCTLTEPILRFYGPARAANGGTPDAQQTNVFEIDDVPQVRRIAALNNPAPAASPPARRNGLWQLVSQMTLNSLSLVEDGEESLQTVLLLNMLRDTPENRQQIAGVRSVKSTPKIATIPTANGPAWVRGVGVEIDFDDTRFPANSAYLFAAVLERFLSAYVSLNSFCQLTATVDGGARRLGQWLPRSGQRPLL